jgi:nitrogen fixation protein FixH
MIIVAFIGVIVAVSVLLWILESNSSESITGIIIDDYSIQEEVKRQIDDEFDHYDSDEQGPEDY